MGQILRSNLEGCILQVEVLAANKRALLLTGIIFFPFGLENGQEKKNKEDKSSFDEVQKWLDNNKDKQELLLKAATYQDKGNCTPLHCLVAAKSPLALAGRLLILGPNMVKVQDNNEYLPLHIAVGYSAFIDVISLLSQAYPKAAEIQDKNGQLPLHWAL